MTIMKKIFSYLTTIVLALVIALCAFLYIGKLNGGKNTLFGNELMVVLSGSMSPTFDTGSIVAIKPIQFEAIQKGDIVTFKSLEDRIITHRVVDIVNGELITKGDANDGKDTDPVVKDRVIGKVQYFVPLIGYAIHFIQSKLGMLIFLAVPGLYLIISQIWKLYAMLKQQEKRDAGGVNAQTPVNPQTPE